MARPFITAYGGHEPLLGPGVFVDVSARVIGQVTLDEGASVWPGAVIRADDDSVHIGAGSCVLDLALVEAPRGHPVTIAPDVLVSHKACLHGASVERGALIGIGAILLDGCRIGEGALIGAGAVVPPGAVIPPGALALGQPAKVIRQLRPDERQRVFDNLAVVREKAARYLSQG